MLTRSNARTFGAAVAVTALVATGCVAVTRSADSRVTGSDLDQLLLAARTDARTDPCERRAVTSDGIEYCEGGDLTSDRVVLLTGDSHEVATHVAAQLGIDEVFSEVLPGQKADVVAKLQQEGAKRVAMVGDGINDAPALARADLGIAIGAGTDVAIESAGVVLASSDPRGVADTITLSHASYRKMLQNLVWATGYNAIGLPVAAGVLAGVGFLMPPAVGAAVMSVSTIVVALNAQLLRRVRFAR